MNVVQVRPGTDHDVRRVRELEQQAFGADAWSETSVEHELAAEGRRSLVALEGERLLGYAVTSTVGTTTDLQRVVVAADARRRGIGSRLVTALVEEAARGGAGRVLLEVSDGNTAALGCYRTLGFAEIARRPSYYRDGSDALVLELHLTVPPTEEQQ